MPRDDVMAQKMSSLHRGEAALRSRPPREGGDPHAGIAAPGGSAGWRRADLSLWSWGDPPVARADYRESRKSHESPDKVGHVGDPGGRSLVIREERALQL